MREQILAVQRMQDYIEKNKAEEISLSDLAQTSLFSPWYAYRLFRNALGLTPMEYIRKYRLTQAASQLRSDEVKVIDAAYNAGFTNVDTFTRAFYREFGLNPSEYMKNPVPVPFFVPYGAKYRELRKENIDVSNIQPIFIHVIKFLGENPGACPWDEAKKYFSKSLMSISSEYYRSNSIKGTFN